MTTTTQIQQATRQARRRATRWRWLAGLCLLGAAGAAVTGLLNLSDAVLDRDLLIDAVSLVFLAALFLLSGWSAARYASAVETGALVRDQRKVQAANESFYRLLGLVAFAVLTVMLFLHAWVVAGVWVFIVLNIIVLYGALTGTYLPSDDGLCTGDDSWSSSSRDSDAEILGINDACWYGDNMMASLSEGDD